MIRVANSIILGGRLRFNPLAAFDEAAMIGMHLADVPTRRIENVPEILWGSIVSAVTASNFSDRTFETVEAWRGTTSDCSYLYVFVGGICLKRSNPFENAAAMMTIGTNGGGYREAADAPEDFAESAERWQELLSRLKGRGLSRTRVLAGGKTAAITGTIAESPSDAFRQVKVDTNRCRFPTPCEEHASPLPKSSFFPTSAPHPSDGSSC